LTILKFLKKIMMLHFLKIINYERKAKNNKEKLKEKIINIRKASIVALLAINYFKKNSDKFIGKTEKYAAKEIKKFCRKRGYRQGFPLILASGENTQKIHSRPSKRIIQKNDIIMIDIGLKRTSHYFSDYCSDSTRTFFLSKPSEFQKEIYNIVQEAHDLALKELKPGIRGYTLHKKIQKFIESKGYELPHGLGHSTKRYTHSAPFLSSYDRNSTLEENDHVTIEPGIYINQNNSKLPKGHTPFGVRIEDLVVIKKKENIILTSLTKMTLF